MHKKKYTFYSYSKFCIKIFTLLPHNKVYIRICTFNFISKLLHYSVRKAMGEMQFPRQVLKIDSRHFSEIPMTCSLLFYTLFYPSARRSCFKRHKRKGFEIFFSLLWQLNICYITHFVHLSIPLWFVLCYLWILLSFF